MLDPSQDHLRWWFLKIYMIILSGLIMVTVLAGAFLDAKAWAQVKPELADIRLWTFQIGMIIVGSYLFSDGRRS